MTRGNDYFSFPRPRKVKHVRFISNPVLHHLEDDVNNFADDNPEFKILGIKIMQDGFMNYVATVTYLENAKCVEYEDSYDDTDEERDFD